MIGPGARNRAAALLWEARWAALLALGLLIYGRFADPFALFIISSALVLSLLALSVDLQWGYTGILNLGPAAYLGLVARRIDPRPEDKKEGEIAEGAGELGFFPPQSIWPLYCAFAFMLVIAGPIFGWWLMLLGFGFGALALTGLVYEYYRGDHAH